MRRLRRCLVLLLSLCLGAAKQYTGSECNGAVDFELENSAIISDFVITVLFSELPAWLTEACQDAARTTYCGQVYGDKAQDGSTGMCKSQCESLLQACAGEAELNDDLAKYLGSENVCAPLSDVNCVEMGELDESLHAEAECPDPLFVMKAHPGVEYEGFVMRVRGTACAVGCPSGDTVYGKAMNEGMELTYFVLAAIGTVSGLVVLVGLKPKGTRLYAWMFTFAGTLAAAASFVYMCLDPNEYLCDEEIGHRRRIPLMIAVAIFIHYFYLLAIIWVCLQSFSVWSIVKNGTRRTQIEQWQKYYMGVSLLLPAVMCSFPAAANNYGYATQVAIPFPMMVFEDTQGYFWATVYAPLVVILVVQVGLTVDAMWSFFKLYRANRSGGQASGVSTSRRDKFVRYNREPLFLLFGVGVFTLLNAVGIGYSLGAAEILDGVENYIRCVLEAAVPGEDKDCDPYDFYDNLFFVAVIQCFYIVSYPIIALITFGPSTFMRKRLAWLAGIFTTPPGSNSYGSDTIGDSRVSRSRHHKQGGSGAVSMKVLNSNSQNVSTASKDPSGAVTSADDRNSTEKHRALRISDV